MRKTQSTFKNILELTKNALFLSERNKKEPSSVYKRFSAHITLDLPDIPDPLKGTANKVESMMSSNNPRHSNMY